MNAQMNPAMVTEPTTAQRTTYSPVGARPADELPHHEPSSRAARMHILVLGHRDEDIAFVREALDTLDVQIDAVPDEAAAGGHLAGQPYDLLVVLLPLPEADGLAVCQRVRAADERLLILLLATTRLAAMDADVLAGFAAGAYAHLVAPIHADELRVRVVALLRRRGVSRPTTPEVASQPEAATSGPAPRSRAPAAGALGVGVGAGLAATRRALCAGRGPIAQRARVVAAAALIVAGVLGDRAVLAAQPSAATSAAAAAAATTTSQAPTATSGSLDAQVGERDVATQVTGEG